MLLENRSEQGFRQVQGRIRRVHRRWLVLFYFLAAAGAGTGLLLAHNREGLVAVKMELDAHVLILAGMFVYLLIAATLPSEKSGEPFSEMEGRVYRGAFRILSLIAVLLLGLSFFFDLTFLPKVLPEAVLFVLWLPNTVRAWSYPDEPGRRSPAPDGRPTERELRPQL